MKRRTLLFAVILFAVLAAGLEWLYRYHFFYIEQNQLFLFSRHYFADMAARPGGIAEWAAAFVVQFFVWPGAGALLTALLLTGVGVLTALVCRRIAPSAPFVLLLPVWLLPVAALLCIHFDFNWSYGGTVAFLVMLAALLVCLRAVGWWRTVLGLILGPVLFWVCGPVALLWAVCLALCEAAAGARRWWFSFVVLAETAAVAWGTLHFSLIGDGTVAFSPLFYYTDNLPPGAEIWFAWAALPVAILCVRLCRDVKIVSRRREILFTAAGIVLAVALLWGCTERYLDRKWYRIKHLDRLAGSGRWDEIVELSTGGITNYLHLNFLNLALAEKGVLADEIFRYDQRNVSGLMISSNNTQQIATLLSDIHFGIGNVALSQQMAFDGYVVSAGGGNPRLLKRLVQTNLIYGTWPVAEKYIDLLSSTLAYRSWAANHRRFLGNDAAVEADPLLGAKRRCLLAENRFFNTMPDNLRAVAMQNPQSTTAIEYLGAMLLLDKDLEAFGSLIAECYGTEVLPRLPRSFQEAVIVLFERDPAMWDVYGVSAAVVERFEGFRSRLQANRAKNGMADIMRASHGDTFWYYMMFK